MTSTHNTRSSAIKSPQSVGPDIKPQNTRHVSQKSQTQNKSSKKELDKTQKLDKVKENSEDKINESIKSRRSAGRNSQRQNVTSEKEQEVDSGFDVRKSPRSRKCDPKSGITIEESDGNTPRSIVKGKRSKVEDEVESNLNFKEKVTLKTPDIKRKTLDTQTPKRTGTKRKIDDDKKDISESENEDEKKQKKQRRVSTTEEEVNKELNTDKRKKNIKENKQNMNQVDEQKQITKGDKSMEVLSLKEDKSVEILSPPRRSARAVIPNRKFKDMEVDYTPNRRNSKGMN